MQDGPTRITMNGLAVLGILTALSLTAWPQHSAAQTRSERTVTVEVDEGGDTDPADTQGQTTPSTSPVEQAVRAMYSDLPESEITTGVLYDRAMPIVDAGQFDGTASTPVMNRRLWDIAYRDLYEAAYETRGMKAPADIAAATEAAPEGIVPIKTAYMEFDQVDPEAYADYRLDFDDGRDQFVRGSNGASPYDERTFFATAPARSEVYGTNVTFHVDQDYYTTNQGVTPQYLRIDFGDGMGLRRVDWGEQVSVNYAGTGLREVHVEAVYDDATREARFEFTVAPAPQEDLEADDAITDLGESANIEGERVEYERYGIYGAGNRKVDKPLVLLDGIDFGNVIDGVDERTFEDIITLFDAPVELVDGTTHCTLSELQSDGYDIFVLNYADGADHIRRNAFALVDLLDWINAPERTGGREQIVVVGPSMGGVVSRYALSYMEDTGKEHNVRLFISYDSPQQGANVPVGLQHMVESFPFESQMATNRRKLERPATRELVKYYALNNTDGVHPLRQQMLDELASYGDYPNDERLTKVAVALGSGQGNVQKGEDGQDLEPHDNLFKLTLNPGIEGIIEYEYEADVYAAPDRRERIVYHSDHYVTKTYLSLKIRVKVPGAGVEREADTPPYDSVPGGRRSFGADAEGASPIGEAEWAESGLQLLDLPFLDADTDYPYSLFIPATSAWAYNTLHPDPYDPYEQNYYYPVIEDSESERRVRSPFDDLVAHQKNERHVVVTPTSYEFVMPHIYHVDESITVDGQTFNDPEPTFKAKQTITAENTTAKSGAELALQAGESITLGPGFKVEKGATFSARVDPSLQDAGEPPQTSTSSRQQATHEYESEETEAANEKKERARAGLAARSQEGGAIPAEYGLSGNYPNPFRRTTRLRYGLPEDAHVRVEVYDGLGRRVETLVNEHKPAGRHRVRFDATALASGTYFCRLKAGDFVATEAMVLVK